MPWSPLKTPGGPGSLPREIQAGQGLATLAASHDSDHLRPGAGIVRRKWPTTVYGGCST